VLEGESSPKPVENCRPAREHSMDHHIEEAELHSLPSNAVEKIVNRVLRASRQNSGLSKQPLSMAEIISRMESPVGPRETVLRVGSLELDLIDRTAKRGNRLIHLRPREFQLLKYMMQRSDQLLTRANLIKDVWHYKFVPETNLVDVHMGLLRRKVDGSNDDPMIRNVRGEGFVLSATNNPLRETDDRRAPRVPWAQLKDIALSRESIRSSYPQAALRERIRLHITLVIFTGYLQRTC
jgi:DNA-binding winged helix-turn-helix (wHTH) protein